ncbi:MAG: DNA-directed RNA polymerase subunit alpha C-terminal domain-containing protein [Planctomycetota bacterium]
MSADVSDPNNDANPEEFADSFSVEDLMEDEPTGATATVEPMPMSIPVPMPPVEEPPGFDLLGVENPSFAVLEEGQAHIYASRGRVVSFRKQVEGLSEGGEEGRRKGLGLWMLGQFDASAKLLASYDGDDVASYTRAQSLRAAGRGDEAAPIFERLSKAYPDEPRPRAGWLLSLLESGVEKLGEDGDARELTDMLLKRVDEAPPSFLGSVEGRHAAGRIHEAAGDIDGALDQYTAGFELEPSHQPNSFAAAFLSERCGLDEDAVRFYEALVHLRPIDERVLMNLGILYEDHGRDQDAAACFDVVVQNRPTDRRARLYLEDAKAGMDMFYDEDLERKEDRLNQILRIPITDFELSVRARNCLNKMQIGTLGDLVCRTEQELLSYKNFGETSLTEIKEILHSKGLRLGMPREEAVASIEAHARRSSTGDQTDVMNKPIMELQLSIRARRTVEALGCLTAGDCTKHSAEELLGMPNFGQTSLQELRSTLAELGLKLKGE